MVALLSLRKNSSLTACPVGDSPIHPVRGRRVRLDRDLVALYGVPTKALKQAVGRNRERFPADFIFSLTRDEFAHLRSQFVTSSLEKKAPGKAANDSVVAEVSAAEHGGVRYLPFVFTQEGAAMRSGVLRSPRAIAVNIEIMRAFVRRRRLTLSVKELATKVDELEQKYAGQFGLVFEAIKELMAPPPLSLKEAGVIGFLGRPKKGRSS